MVLGLSEVPEAGDILRVVADDKAARAMVEQRKAETAAKSGDGSGRATLEDLYRQIQAGQAKELRIILKADVSGSLGAITHALEQLDQDEVRINVLHEAAGDITDNDIMLATASDAIVVGFSTKITDTARRAAEAEGVDVRLYDIIYKLTDDIEAALKGLLEPEIVEVVEGRAEVRQVIRVGKNTVIAGSYVTDGRIVRGGARIWRGGQDHRDRPDRVAATLPRRRPRGPDQLRVRHRARQLPRPGRGRRHRVLRLADGVARRQRVALMSEPPRRPATGSMSQRTDRVDQLLREEIGAIVTRDVADPRVGFATITRVETTSDLRHAKVWVSVIGQPAERTATIAALGRAMPFVRHELGKSLRIRRIPDLHVHLDDTAERGTRVLQLLNELEAGASVDEDLPLGETLPTPVPRLHHEGDSPVEPPSAVIPPKPRAKRRRGDRPQAPMTVDLGPFLAAVPDAVVERLRGARRVLAVSHENPDADTLGASLGIVSIVEALGGTADPVCTDPVPPLYDFLPGVERVRHGPRSRRRLRPARDRRTAAASSGSAPSACVMRSCSRDCPASSSTITPPTTPPATPTGSIRGPPRRARWSPWSPADSAWATTGSGGGTWRRP